jgi:hypothetical protein
VNVTDDDLIEYAKIAVGREHGLSPPQARRLVGSTLRDLHADAATMAGELGIEDPYTPEPGQARDGAGRFAGSRGDPGTDAGGGMNRLIRQRAGR